MQDTVVKKLLHAAAAGAGLLAFAIVLFAAILSLAHISRAHAEGDDPLRARLSAERVGDVEPGEYGAGDNLEFSLATDGDKFLLRFAGSPEIFALHVERASLGGRELKYDYGATALRVSAWGGMTIYTYTAPNGLPASRLGDAPRLAPPSVSPDDLQNALRDATSHFLYARQLRIDFSASKHTSDDDARTLAFGALANAAYGLDRFSTDNAGRTALRKITAVEIETGDQPAVELSGRLLRVRFATGRSYAGLASSQTIERALGKLLSVPIHD